MSLFTPLFMQAAEGDDEVVYNGLDLRLMLTGTWASEGVTSAASFKVTQRDAGANLSVDVAGGIAVVTGNDVNIQGTYMCASDAVENLTIPAPPDEGSVIHRVILWVRDKLYDGTLDANTYEFTVELQEDDGSGTPDLPDSAIPLALVTVTSEHTSVTDDDITDARISAMTTPSWIRQVDSDTDRPAIPLEGEEIWRTDQGFKEVWDGSDWRQVPLSGGDGTAWSTYTPTLTANTTNPNLGSGASRVGRYVREGRRVHVQVLLRFGTSGVSAGSGHYDISLPVAARAMTQGRQVVGSAFAWDSSSTNFWDGVAFVDINDADEVRVSINSVVMDNNSPFVFAANDEIGFCATYEAAS